MYDPIFENLLDIKSYDFVQNANKNLNSNIVKLMANELMEHIVNDKIKIFSLKNSENYGIALNIILEYNLLTNNAQKIVAAFTGYWCLSNHISNNEYYYLTTFNRGNIVNNNLDLFTELYKISIEKNYNNTITDFGELKFAKSTIKNLSEYDLFKVKNEIELKHGVTVNLNNNIKFYTESYYEKIHNILTVEIYNTMTKR
jgi:hypothetical protein